MHTYAYVFIIVSSIFSRSPPKITFLKKKQVIPQPRSPPVDFPVPTIMAA